MYPLLTKKLVMADGQVAASAAAVLAGARDVAARYDFTFTNVGANAETLVITFSRDGGTQRQLRQVALDPDETFELCGLPVNKGDVVYAATTDALSVDYLVAEAAEGSPPRSGVYDATGLPKTSPQVLEQLAAVLS